MTCFDVSLESVTLKSILFWLGTHQAGLGPAKWDWDPPSGIGTRQAELGPTKWDWDPPSGIGHFFLSIYKIIKSMKKNALQY